MRSNENEPPQVDPQSLRRAQPLNEALPATIRWAAELPRAVWPMSLLCQFPRIANGLAQAWPTPLSFDAYLESLMNDRRGGRRGFPQDVQDELLKLRDFFQSRYYGPRERHTRGRYTPVR
jgi:hypothetical protein